MIIFFKKRILFLCSIFILSISFYSIINQNNIHIPTSSIPISNHTIIIDAGHGLPDGGAVSSDGTTIESELNLQVVLKLQSLLESSNCTVILTRSDENGIYTTNTDSIRSKKISDMKNRAIIANESDAELFISIHMNKLPQTQYNGWQTFYKNEDEKSIKLANSIQKNLDYFIDKNNNRTIKSIKNIYLTKNVTIPLVIVECGFLSNTLETEKLKTENYQEILAWSIYSGIMDYFKD